MIAATSMLRPPPERIGRISDKVVLPRSIELKKALAGGAGLLVGALFWVALWGPLVGFSLEGFLVIAGLFTALGVGVVTLSPIRGESLFKWMSLSAEARRGDRVLIDGQPARAYIGLAPLHFTAAGPIRILPGAVDVLPGTFDDRGVPLDRAALRLRRLEGYTGAPALPGPEEGFSPARRLGAGEELDGAHARNATPGWARPAPLSAPGPHPYGAAPGWQATGFDSPPRPLPPR